MVPSARSESERDRFSPSVIGGSWCLPHEICHEWEQKECLGSPDKPRPDLRVPNHVSKCFGDHPVSVFQNSELIFAFTPFLVYQTAAWLSRFISEWILLKNMMEGCQQNKLEPLPTGFDAF